MAAFDDDEDVIRAKVVILGSAGVGKTCLVIKYKTGNFPSMPSPTIGASYMAKTVQVTKEHKLKLQMWVSIPLDCLQTFYSPTQTQNRTRQGKKGFNRWHLCIIEGRMPHY